MKKQVSFIHVADLHLDSPFNGLANIPETIFEDIRRSTFTALDHLVEAAIDRQVDFVCIVGDLFDNEKQSIKAQIKLNRAFQTLEKHNIFVYLSYGNHDHMKGNIHPITYPDNVFIFSSEKVRPFIFKKEGHPLAEIHGFSYEERAVLENKVSEYHIVNESIPFHIAMLHGSLASNTVHDTYAPFQMSDLLEKDFDYWALGHIHQREILQEQPFIVYPGNIQGRHRKETGEKGCYHVVLSETDAALDFIPLQAIAFQQVTIDVSTCDEIHQLERKIITNLMQQQSMTPKLIDLMLISTKPNLAQWKNDYDVEDVIELINETLINQYNWQYIFRTSITIKQSAHDQSSYEGDYFIGEISSQFEEISIQPHVKELYRHKQGRKYLDMLTEEEEQLIKEEARQLLLYELLNNGGE